MASTIVLIMGANSGVGFATAKVLASASKDYHIILTGRTLTKVLSSKSEIESTSPIGSLSAIHLDVTDQSSIDLAVAHVSSTFGRLDILINNAAVGTRGPDVRKRYQECMDVNAVGPAVVAAAFRPMLLKSENPYSIFVSSGAGSMGRSSDPTQPLYRGGLPNGGAYRASKAALNMIALQEFIEFGEMGLKVFAMSPGFVKSNLRGTSEEEISGWGGAGDPIVAGETMLKIVRGERDADVGKLVTKDGIYPW